MSGGEREGRKEADGQGWGLGERREKPLSFSTIEEISVNVLVYTLPNTIGVYEDVGIWVHKCVLSLSSSDTQL